MDVTDLVNPKLPSNGLGEVLPSMAQLCQSIGIEMKDVQFVDTMSHSDRVIPQPYQAQPVQLLPKHNEERVSSASLFPHPQVPIQHQLAIPAPSPAIPAPSTPASATKSPTLGSGKYQCPFESCGRFCDRPSVLKTHIRTHTGERPFQCPHCPKGFAARGTLNAHIRVHTNERPFPCPHPGCGMAFRQSTHLRRHRQVKHGTYC